jgi:peptidoglycan/LPS O-acetylase OafA/YrhL
MAHAGVSGTFRGFGGENAVEIFFMISGFYVALILDNSYSSIRLFYTNRILRLYPIYFLVCALILIRHAIFADSSNNLFNYPAVALLIGTLANTTLIGSDWIMFLQWNENGLQFGPYGDSQLQIHQMLFIPQAWSLGAELTFYALAPFICKVKTLKLSC